MPKRNLSPGCSPARPSTQTTKRSSPLDVDAEERLAAERLDVRDACPRAGPTSPVLAPRAHVLGAHAEDEPPPPALGRAAAKPSRRSAAVLGGPREAHRRAADEARDEAVGGPLVELLGRADLLEHARRS